MARREQHDPDFVPVRFLGTTDDVTTCDHCGKPNLKNTVALSIGGGDAVYYGVTCAARALRRTAKEIRGAARDAEHEIAKLVSRERRRIEALSYEEGRQWLNEHVPGHRDDRFRQLEALGGMEAARDAGMPDRRRYRWERVEEIVRERFARGEVGPLTDDDYPEGVEV